MQSLSQVEFIGSFSGSISSPLFRFTFVFVMLVVAVAGGRGLGRGSGLGVFGVNRHTDILRLIFVLTTMKFRRDCTLAGTVPFSSFVSCIYIKKDK